MEVKEAPPTDSSFRFHLKPKPSELASTWIRRVSDKASIHLRSLYRIDFRPRSQHIGRTRPPRDRQGETRQNAYSVGEREPTWFAVWSEFGIARGAKKDGEEVE